MVSRGILNRVHNLVCIHCWREVEDTQRLFVLCLINFVVWNSVANLIRSTGLGEQSSLTTYFLKFRGTASLKFKYPVFFG